MPQATSTPPTDAGSSDEPTAEPEPVLIPGDSRITDAVIRWMWETIAEQTRSDGPYPELRGQLLWDISFQVLPSEMIDQWVPMIGATLQVPKSPGSTTYVYVLPMFPAVGLSRQFVVDTIAEALTQLVELQRA